MRIRSFAKINLGLEVCGKRADGYHNIRTLFQSIELHDCLVFTALPGREIRLEGTDRRVSWDKSNLIYQAAELIRAHSGCRKGVSVFVEKRIPPGGGLGGGSSNAAAALFALNRMWGLDLRREKLMEMGRCLGADVPYFFSGGLCLGTERGDRIQELPDLETMICLLVLEKLPVSTAAVYNRLPATLTSPGKDSKIIKFLKDRRTEGLHNDLEDVVFELYPQGKDHKQRLQDAGAKPALVSGSGSTVFGIFLKRSSAEKAREKLGRKSQITQTLSRWEYRKRTVIKEEPGV